MLHRNLMRDDERGLDEPLLDLARATVTVALRAERSSLAAREARRAARRRALELARPCVARAWARDGDGDARAAPPPPVLAPGFALPPGVELVSAQAWPSVCGEGVWPAPLAVRLQHLDDDDGGAPEAVVELAGMLAGARACAVARVPLDYGVLAPCEGAAPPEAAATPQRHAVEPGALAAFVLHFVCETRPRPGAAG